MWYLVPLLTKRMHRLTLCWFSVSLSGILMIWLTTGGFLHLVVLPFRLAMSLPHSCSTQSMSSVITGQLLMAFIEIAFLRSLMFGNPNKCGSFIAALAQFMSCSMQKLSFSLTVLTRHLLIGVVTVVPNQHDSLS